MLLASMKPCHGNTIDAIGILLYACAAPTLDVGQYRYRSHDRRGARSTRRNASAMIHDSDELAYRRRLSRGASRKVYRWHE